MFSAQVGVVVQVFGFLTLYLNRAHQYGLAKALQALGVEIVDVVSVVQHHPDLLLARPLDCGQFSGPDPKTHTLAAVGM